MASCRSLPHRSDRGKFFRKILVLFLCATLPISLGARWGFNKLRYRDVARWPSVPAEIQALYQTHYWGRVESRTGSSWRDRTFNTVNFTYRVGGIVYQGRKPSPDGRIPLLITGSSPGKPSQEPEFRAYYKPDQPEVAVLFPYPYKGDILLYISLFSALILVFAIVVNRAANGC